MGCDSSQFSQPRSFIWFLYLFPIRHRVVLMTYNSITYHVHFRHIFIYAYTIFLQNGFHHLVLPSVNSNTETKVDF